jgi:hypothetical protein
MNLKNKILLIIVIIFSFQSFCQNNFSASMSSSLHEKYWFYRERLKYFVVPGEGSGESIVYDVRNLWETQDLTLGDQTIDLAWYLGILALEAEQLSWQDDMTLTELYYAIKAFERLDMCEDKYPWNKPTSELDGFFMRFDAALIDSSYHHDMTNFNQGLDESDVFLTQPPGMPTYVNRFRSLADVDWNNDASLYNSSVSAAMSQDQAAAMLMGLALVKKFAPSGEVFFFNTVENVNDHFNFQECAKSNALNITTYLKNSFIDIPDPEDFFEPDYIFLEEILQFSNLTDDWEFGNWVITDPNNNGVQRGYDAHFARKGYLSACEKITENNISFPADGLVNWEAIAHFLDFNVAPPGPYYNRIIWANLAVIADNWKIITPNPFGPDFEIRTTPGTLDRLLKKSSLKRYEIHTSLDGEISITEHEDYPPTDTDHEKLYNLIWVALNCNVSQDMYDKINDYEPRIEEILTSAPLCGPYSFSKDDTESEDLIFNFDGCINCLLPNRAAPGWRSSNRFRNEPYEFNGFKYHNTGNYPGHDYMMLYNLYRNYRIWWYGSGDGIGSYRNMIESFESQTYPYIENNIYYGTISNPANLRSFETFRYNGEIDELNNQKGSLNIRAGNTIVLEPGCHIKNGSNFNAKIEKYDCWDVGNGNKSSTFYDNNYVQNQYNISPMKYSYKTIDSRDINQSPITSFSIYPNPSHEYIKIECTLGSSEYNLRILDINGSVLISKIINPTETIDISQFDSGVYVAEILVDGFSKKNKFIKL